jgi:hypothetical protein
LDELRDFANRRNMAKKLVGGGIRGAGTRALLDLDLPEDATKAERAVYENTRRAAAPVMGLAAAPAAIKTAGRALKDAPRTQALETARQNAVKMLGLPENNTAMDRARAMGFDTDAVHFSRHGIDATELDSGKFAVAPFDAVGTHVGSKDAAMDRFKNTVATTGQIKGSTYPVVIKRGNEYLANNLPWQEDALSSNLRKVGGHDWSDINGGRMTYQQMNADLRNKLFKEQGFGSIPYINDVEAKGSVSYIVPPQNIRSRFAAFDPARINENDLLASLAAMGISIPMILGLLDEERVD